MPIKDDINHLGTILKTVAIGDIMSKPVKTINVNEDFSRTEELFVKLKIRHLPVVDNSKKLIGLISQRDVYRAVSPRRFVDGTVYFREGIIIDQDGYYEKESLNQFILNHIMHKNPKALTADRPIGNALHIMVTDKVGCVPIVDKDYHVVGVITRFDFLKFADQIYIQTLKA